MALLYEILRWLTAAVGVLVVYLAAFTYEGTDRLIKNRLEDLWLRLASCPATPFGVARRLVRVVLALMDKILDRLFGPNRLSIRTLSIALCYAYSGLLLSSVPLSLYVRLAAVELPTMIREWGRPHLIIAAVAFVMGTLPALHASLRWATYFTVFCILSSLGLSVWVLTNQSTGGDRAARVDNRGSRRHAQPVLAVALAYGIGVVHAIRYGVQRTASGETTRTDFILVGSVLMIPIVAFAALTSVALIVRHPRGQLTLWLASRVAEKKGVMSVIHSASSRSLCGGSDSSSVSRCRSSCCST